MQIQGDGYWAKASVKLNFSESLKFGESVGNPCDPSTYNIPHTEEELLHHELVMEDFFRDSLNKEETERLMAYLTVPYLRIPLVLEFFSQDRASSLLNGKLRRLLESAIFQPLAFTTDVKISRQVPVARDQKGECARDQ